MLNERIAINPSLFADEESIGDLLYALKRNIKWSEGRVIAELPKGWYLQAEKYINSSTNDFFKTKAKAALHPHKIQLVPIKSKTQVAKWDDYIDENTNRVISIFFTTQRDPSKGCLSAIEIHDYLDQSEFRVGSFETSGLSVEEIIVGIDDFLFLNKRITIVNPDQWLCFGKSNKLFKELMKRWVQYGGVDFKVIRSRRRDRSDEVKCNWQTEIDQTQTLLELLGYKGRFKFIAVNDDPMGRGKVLHDRFLLGGTTGGIQMGYGLEPTKPPKSNKWVIMKASSYQEEKAYFMDHDVRELYEDEATDYYSWIYRP